MGAEEGDLFRLQLGSDYYERLQTKIENLQDNLLQVKDIAHLTSY
jgi:hypothetical protein